MHAYIYIHSYICVYIHTCMRTYIRVGNNRLRIVKCELISSQMRVTFAKAFAMYANQLRLFCKPFVLIVLQFD